MSIKRDLQALAAQISAKIEQLPEEVPVLYRIRVVAAVLNVRAGPGTTFADVGDVLAGQEFDVYEEAPNGWRRIHPAEQRWVSGGAGYTTRLIAP